MTDKGKASEYLKRKKDKTEVEEGTREAPPKDRKWILIVLGLAILAVGLWMLLT